MKRTLAIIVGRFQTPEITPGHEFLFDEVFKEHNNVVVFLGSKPNDFQPDEKNCLDFFARRLMFQSKYPNASVLGITDNETNEGWSYDLDSKIDSIKGNYDVVLYGSRDSFIPYYRGKYKTIEVQTKIEFSATSVREKIIETPIDDYKFRAGIIYGNSTRIVCGVNKVYPVLIKKNIKGELFFLEIKKCSTNKSTLLEATFNPETDDCNSDTAKRAIKEHLGNNLELANGIYLHDQKLNHWAYKSSRDKIHATFMFVEFLWGT